MISRSHNPLVDKITRIQYHNNDDTFDSPYSIALRKPPAIHQQMKKKI